MAEKNNRRRKAPRQNWNPSFPLRVLNRLWRIALSALKIVGGAVATVLLIAIVCGFVFISLLGQYLQEDIIPMAHINLDNYDMEKTSYIYYFDENGNVQILQQLATTTDRRWVDYEDIPEELIQAAVAIEDKRFYEHQGVDWITTIKACANMFFGGGDTFGGSTLTQQLVKNILLMDDETADDVTVQRKLLEIFRALQFEKTYDKEVVIEYYMNTVYFGHLCYGVKSAAEYYFGKELQDMNTAELAALIGITNNPSMFDPYSTKVYGVTGEEKQDYFIGADRNRYRQQVVLTQMHVQGWLTEEDYLDAYNYELTYKRSIDDEDRWNTCRGTFDAEGNQLTEGCGYEGPVRDLVTQTDKNDNVTYFCPECGSRIDITIDASLGVYSWYVDTVIEDVAKELAARDGVTEWTIPIRRHYVDLVCRSGYHIYTPFDPKVQEAVDNIYTDLSQIPAVKNSNQLLSAIVIVDNTTGDIVAMAGSVGEKIYSDAFNHATDEGKQIGSTIKPLTVYAPAFDAGLVTPATIIDDLPLYYTGSNQRPYPVNYDGVYRYQRTIWRGIINSYNTIAANTLELMGTKYSYNFAKYKLGLSGLVEEYVTDSGTTLSDVGVAALSMGGLTLGLSVRDVTSAYATFANNGVYREGRTYTLVLDDKGDVVINNEQYSEQVLSEKAINYINYCLDSVVATGTGTSADMYKELGMDVAGKTGTTQSSKDLYFAGYTGHYTAAVWSGFREPERIILSGSSVSPSTRLWKKVMLQIHEGLETIPLYDADSMINVTICLESGKLASEACRNDIRTSGSSNLRYETVLVYPEDAPTELCDKHISVDYCTSGNGVANAYCHHFSSVGAAVLREKSLVKMTQTRLDELKLAYKAGLHDLYKGNEHIYLVDHFGNPQPFFGVNGDINQGQNVPYQVCTVHTAQSWEAYKKNHPWIDGGTQEPDPEPDPGDGTGTQPGDGSQNEPGEQNGDGTWLEDLLEGIFGN